MSVAGKVHLGLLLFLGHSHSWRRRARARAGAWAPAGLRNAEQGWLSTSKTPAQTD